jgi:prevent-host-death family protein
MVMTDVRIAGLKSRLSEYLRQVRKGRSVTILDRDTPIARIVPFQADGAALSVREPAPGAPRLSDVPLPPPLSIRGDIVALLLEERQGNR